MADHPDPTRRLRPLHEARTQRRVRVTEPGPSVDGAVAGGARVPAASTGDGWVPTWGDSAAVRGPGRPVRSSEGDDRAVGDRGAVARGPRTADVGAQRAGPAARWGTDVDDGDPDDGDPDDGDPDDGQLDESDDEVDAVVPRVRRGWRPWARWRERWVPAGPGVRVDPGRRGSALISLVAVAAVVVAGLGFFEPDGTVVGPSTVAVVEGETAASTESPAGGPPGSGSVPMSTAVSSSGPDPSELSVTEIVVAVTGGVVHPGVVTLKPGSRVADAIAAAGGVVDGTDYTGLNLAAKLTDGDSVVVGGNGQGLQSRGVVGGAAATTAAGAGSPIDLNAADQATLETLPGVGPVMAGNIVDWRETHGGFSTVEQLQDVTGIGAARFATLAPLVRVG